MTTTFRESDVTRVPAGTSAGGSFAEHIRSNPEAVLTPSGNSDDVMTQLSLRRRTLREAGYIPAASGPADGDPRSTAHIDQWWESHYNRAELAAEKSYAIMPDDYTPNHTSGRSLDENRRTHRMRYEGAEVALRMPSATAIRRYSAENGNATFDVPVEATYPGGTVSGYVRVTQRGSSAWSVSGLNMDADANAYVAEAVSAVLEHRNPTRALPACRDLLARRRDRFAASGVLVKPIKHSSFITGMGYNQTEHQMVVQMGVGENTRTYGYHVPRDAYNAAVESYSPGAMYNRLVKGQPGFAVAFHETCGRYYNTEREHRCVSAHRERTDTIKLFNTRIMEHVAAAV